MLHDSPPPSGVTNLRRSSRLMQSAKPVTKKMGRKPMKLFSGPFKFLYFQMLEASNNKQSRKRAKKIEKSEKKDSFSCGDPKNIGRMGAPVKYDLERLNTEDKDILKDCATLAIQDYAIQNLQNWRDWRLLKIVEVDRVKVSGTRYYITFKAAKNGHGAHYTFQADVSDNIKYARRVNGFRTLKPRSIWSKLIILPPCIVIQRISRPEVSLLSPPVRMGEDSRNTYNDKWAEKSDKTLTPRTDLVNLELDKLSDKDMDILKGCATLAMHDHLIQILDIKWRDWKLIEIVTACRSHSDSGYIYSLNFQIEHEDSARTLEAEVLDGTDQRRVITLRVIKPESTNWYPGELWIPI